MSWLYDGQPSFVQVSGVALLGAAAGALRTLLKAPGTAAAALAVDLQLLAALAPDNPAAWAAQLQTLLGDYVAGIVGDAAVNSPALAAAPPTPLAPAGTEISSRGPPLPNDLSYGLSALAQWAPAAPPALIDLAPETAAETGNAAALAALIQGAATAALAALYAQTQFQSSADAQAASATMAALVDAQLWAAGNAGNDAAFLAWQSLKAASLTDLYSRGAELPNIMTVALQAPLPALLLAQRLYQDGTQAPALVGRNRAPHPLFMPATIEALVG